MDDRERLRQRFNRVFARWDIELPRDALSPGKVWLIAEEGWTIWTRFDVCDDGGRARLDYYAMHRMTNDRHVRLRVDGIEEFLPAMAEHYSLPENASQAQRKEAEEKFYADNRAIGKLLEEKGFVMTDQAHTSAILNRFLLTDPEDQS